MLPGERLQAESFWPLCSGSISEKKGSDADARYGSKLHADDYLASYPDPDDAVADTDELREILRTAGMTPAKWRSNAPRVMAHPKADRGGGGGGGPPRAAIFRVISGAAFPDLTTKKTVFCSILFCISRGRHIPGWEISK